MIARMPPTQLALASLCGGLTLILAYEIAAPIAPVDVPRSAQTYRPAAITFQDTANAPSSASFGDIDAHPVFSAARTPIASRTPLGTSGGSSAFPSDVSLIGVIIEGRTRLALVRTASAPFATSVPQGGQIEGWTITEIDPDRIVLSSGVTRQQILLAANRGTQSGLSETPTPSQMTPPAPGAGTVITPPPNQGVGPGAGIPGVNAPPPPNISPSISNKPPPDGPPPATHQ